MGYAYATKTRQELIKAGFKVFSECPQGSILNHKKIFYVSLKGNEKYTKIESPAQEFLDKFPGLEL